MKLVFYSIEHEEELAHQKHVSHPILVNCGTDNFSIRNNDKGIDVIIDIEPLDCFSFKQK